MVTWHIHGRAGCHTSICPPYAPERNRVDIGHTLEGELQFASLGTPVALPTRPFNHSTGVGNGGRNARLSLQAYLREPEFFSNFSSPQHLHSHWATALRSR